MRTRVALLAVAEELAQRNAEVLAEQVEQRRLDRGDHVVEAQVDLVRLLEHRRFRRGGDLVLVSRARLPAIDSRTAFNVRL